MSSITYTFQIIRVDEAARCMEVVYNSEGNPTMHIGARLPYEGETLEQIVKMYAPVSYWEELRTPVLIPEVGTTGVIVTESPPPPAPAPTRIPTTGEDQPTVTGAQTL